MRICHQRIATPHEAGCGSPSSRVRFIDPDYPSAWIWTSFLPHSNPLGGTAISIHVGRPVGRIELLHEGRRRAAAWPAGDGVKIDRVVERKLVDRQASQALRDAARHDATPILASSEDKRSRSDDNSWVWAELTLRLRSSAANCSACSQYGVGIADSHVAPAWLTNGKGLPAIVRDGWWSRGFCAGPWPFPHRTGWGLWRIWSAPPARRGGPRSREAVGAKGRRPRARSSRLTSQTSKCARRSCSHH
jgi:hypothetical protein